MARTSSDAADSLPFGVPNVEAEDERLPLIVDMDGFVIQADVSADSTIADLERQVVCMRRAVRGETQGISAERIAEYARKGIDVSHLHLYRGLAAYLVACIEKGRTVHFLTSASQEIAEAVAGRIGLFASVTGAVSGRSMTAYEKLGQARERCPRGFVYAGREPSLIAAADALVVPMRDRFALAAAQGGDTRIEVLIEQPAASAGTWMKVLGCQSWLRHALVFLPVLLTPASFGVGSLGLCAAGLVMLCMAASSASAVEALMRLYDDRRHVAVRCRPLALGEIEPGLAAAVAVMLGAGSFMFAMAFSPAACLCVLGYVASRLVCIRVRAVRDADRSGRGSSGEPALLVVWSLALGVVLTGLTVVQVLPAIVIVLAAVWARRYLAVYGMLRRSRDLSDAVIADRRAVMRR